MSKIVVVVGTRPEIIKMSPIVHELDKRSMDYCVVHTGQHYSYGMDELFFEQLKLPKPKHNIAVGSGTDAEETGKMLMGLEKVLRGEKPSVIIVEGDTNTCLAGALVGRQLHIKVAHVEAGLRSYDRNMPEETNRVIVDHCSDYLFAPTRQAVTTLWGEGIHDRSISLTGNTIVDMVYKYRKSNVKQSNYMLLTLHRQENVDDADRFGRILQGLAMVKAELEMPVFYPIHPRSAKMLHAFGFRADFELMQPVGYFEFLALEQNAKLIFTDSGGVQEEACILGVPCVTLRDNTERPETIEVGANILAGASPEKILQCAKDMVNRKKSWVQPFGNGRAGQKIVEIIGGICG